MGADPANRKRSHAPFIVAAAAIGIAIGLGAYTFAYAKGTAYLHDDPAACGNCHVMRDHLAAWGVSSHHTVAVCNDCHTPKGFVAKYMTKALNGYHHSVAFTSGKFPDPIRITPRNAEIAEAACRKCHTELTSQIDPSHGHGNAALSCVRCHPDVGHPF